MDFKNLLSPNIAKCKGTIILLLCFVVVTVTGFVNSTKNVTVVADGNKMVVNTVYDNPKSILKQAGVKLDSDDALSVSTGKVTDNSIITVKRAFPVTLNIDGNYKVVNTTATTVNELMQSLGLDEDNYFINSNKDARLQHNSTVKLEKVSSKLVLKDQIQEYSTITEDDSSLTRGQTVVSQPGKVGLNRLLVREKYKNGVKVEEQVVQTTSIVKPKERIVKNGTADPYNIGNRSYSRVLTMNASAYLPSDGGGSGYTATGIKARHGVVAVDPRIIPLGTRLFIPGYGEAIAADTGGAIRGNHIDLCMESYSSAMAFGRRTIQVYILN